MTKRECYMLNYNENILNENIRMLMKERNTKQQELADILGMAQSNVSKALNPNDKKCFTLDQVVGIARYYGWSVDRLVGINRNLQENLSQREIASCIVALINGRKALLREITVEEDQYRCDDCYPQEVKLYKNINSRYLAMYIPNYWPCDNEDPTDISQIYGNSTRLCNINEFLEAFQSVRSMYEQGQLSDKNYDNFVNTLLENLSDI